MAKYEAIAFWHTLEKKNLFRTWRDNVQYSIQTRKAADTLAEIRGDVFFGRTDAIDAEMEKYKRKVAMEQHNELIEHLAPRQRTRHPAPVQSIVSKPEPRPSPA